MTRNLFCTKSTFVLSMAVAILSVQISQAQTTTCSNLQVTSSNGSAILTSDILKTALIAALSQENSGLKNQMWATIVDRDGNVCAVAFSGINRGAQWPGSRVISAQKANTANAFSLDTSSFNNGSGQADGLALSTANLFTAVQSGGSLF